MTITQLIIYLLIAAVVSVIAERLVGSGPWGLLGNIIVGLIGIWLMLNVLHIVLPGDPNVDGVPIITAIVGAMIVRHPAQSAPARHRTPPRLAQTHLVTFAPTPTRSPTGITNREPGLTQLSHSGSLFVSPSRFPALRFTSHVSRLTLSAPLDAHPAQMVYSIRTPGL